MKLAVFDFDSTLMDGETIDFLADELGIGQEVAHITEEAMSGRLDFFESLTTRVGLLKGLEYKKAVDICKELPLMKGAKELIPALKEKGYKVVCFSGGFRIGTSPAKDVLGLDADFSNVLHEKDGILTGLVGGDMMFSHSKGDMIQRLQSLLGVTRADTLVCGDGANDLSMFAHADTRIAFCARDVLKKEANIIIDEKDLTKILEKI
ncbi:phosphoserine phosphatase SerB [Poseidonibacter ostreae]|jgi:phosphoserine phosphatase|uniref:Phosphoserine phosphatase n=1 Tax=Poseidonibacter ostreae TaxID=2654171 RepID=A0A6L4WRT3_9BACT|nr:phosphoserine phosphatase SerB [Poseidonibacter ostreae]KAB7886485.1 phosphoserine phosphatase SerB [Poseidonibacter ostreae]KAB7887466.1 phosphoserine phosphatase SerB [Poseidonibacter ostreae]KAB7891845.1 phosphoserine phosphatase SerB [Poseidonibacter ostreae]MAC82819.1 phosphoserine phosphatase SerB [Arcobacter sp.]|tara:strand:- start:6525 stop:7145 length:621 start_codon:yes stop_codon:yes gene_type:complete